MHLYNVCVYFGSFYVHLCLIFLLFSSIIITMLSTILILYLVFNVTVSLNFYFSLLLIFPSYSLLFWASVWSRSVFMVYIPCAYISALSFISEYVIKMLLNEWNCSDIVPLFKDCDVFLWHFSLHFLPLLTFPYSFHTVSVLVPLIWHFVFDWSVLFAWAYSLRILCWEGWGDVSRARRKSACCPQLLGVEPRIPVPSLPTEACSHLHPSCSLCSLTDRFLQVGFPVTELLRAQLSW